LVVVHELGRNASTPDADAIFAKVRQAVWDEHELKLHAVALVKKFGVPRTSSGKIQRFVCRENFLSQTLPVLAEWKAPPEAAPVPEAGSRRNGVLTAAAIQNWLIVRTSELLDLKPFEVDTRVPFGQYGFDSIKAVSLSAELEDWIGLSLPPTLLWDYPNIDSLSNYLVSRAREVKERQLSASPNGAGPGS
jgi:acyl carrier protein